MSDNPKPLVLVIDPDPKAATSLLSLLVAEGVRGILLCDRQIAFGRPEATSRYGRREQGGRELRWNDSDREDQRKSAPGRRIF